MSDSNSQKRDLSPDDLIEIRDRNILKVKKLEQALYHTLRKQYPNLQKSFDEVLNEAEGITSLPDAIAQILECGGYQQGISVKLLQKGQEIWDSGYLKIKIELTFEPELDPSDPVILSRVNQIVDTYYDQYPNTAPSKEVLKVLNSLIVLIPGKELPMGDTTVHEFLDIMLNSFKRGEPEDLISAAMNEVVHQALDRIVDTLIENTRENSTSNSPNDTLESEIIETETSPLDDIRKTLNQTLNP